MRQTLPHYICIGGTYTGWQTLLPLVTAHPAISNITPHTNFFVSKEFSPAALTTYSAQFKRSDALLTGECSPAYLYNKSAPKRIVNSCPETKLLALISHPLHRLVQEWKHTELRQRTPRRCYDFGREHPRALDRGLYGEALTHYFSYYSPLQLQVVIYEDFVHDPLRVLRNIYGFLGVNQDFIPLPLKAYAPLEEEPKFKPFIVKRLMRWLPQQYKRYRDAKAQLTIAPPPALRHFFSPEEIVALLEYYRADKMVIQELLARDLTEVWQE
jgi:hypothetical protein